MTQALAAVRQAMTQAGIHVYIIPTDDFHGSEYVGDYFKCREYVSGFTGSAGTLAVTAQWAGLWTDGRYFLQAAEQLAGSGITLCKMGEPGVPTLGDWLRQTLSPGDVLGFDGRTMTAAQGEIYTAIADSAGAQVVYQRDLVGELWTDRPPMSQSPVWQLDIRYTGKSRREKLAALREELHREKADSHLLTSLDDLAWLLNLRGGDVDCCPVLLGYFFITQETAVLYAQPEKFSRELRHALETDGVTLRPYFSIYEDIAALPPGRVLADPKKVNHTLMELLPGTPIHGENPTTRFKGIKTAAEQENEILAHKKDGAALTRFMKWLKEAVGHAPISEISAAQRLEAFRREDPHYLGASFDPIFGYGAHGAIVHYSATPESDAALAPHGFLLSDTGGHYLEGSTDVTRTFALGPVTPEMRRHYTLVLRGNLRLGAAVFKKGTTGAQLDLLARQPLWSEGLDYNHGTGHGVGYLLCVHEGPQSIRCSSLGGGGTALQPGMITSNEPGLYLEGQYGIRLENLVLCQEKFSSQWGQFLGFRTLTMCPFDLDAVDPAGLTEEETALLNAYHQTVYETLSPMLTPEEGAWLRHATRPI